MSDDDVPAGTEELAGYIEARFGDRFDDERREKLRELIAKRREQADALDDADLSNGDEPAFTFRARRGGE